MSCQTKKMRKVGILGGSFDPIHNGHLAIAESARKDYALDEIWFIPAGHSPNKEEARMTPAEERLKMTELAVRDYDNFKVSDMEVCSKETSYTYRTLERLTAEYPETEFYFIMGADSLDYFDKWYHAERICQCAVILVAVRDEFSKANMKAKIAEIQQLFPADIRILSIGKVEVSSHEIREQIAEGRDVPAQIPHAVSEYIRETGLYR